MTISELSGKKLLIFDTAHPTGGDYDLRTPGSGSGNTSALGNVLIISEDGDESDPDDDENGGTMVFEFALPVSGPASQACWTSTPTRPPRCARTGRAACSLRR